jgi:DNA polymerase-3 subunit epsilon
MAKLIFIDTETTGFDAKKNAMIQLAAILEVDGEERSRIDLRVRPFDGAVIEESALKVNGATPEMLAEFPEEAEAFAAWVSWLEAADSIAQGVAEFAGYNTPFDARFVDAFHARNERPMSEFFNMRLPQQFDALAIARKRFSKCDVANHKLGTIAEHVLGAEEVAAFSQVNGLHNAMTDIEITRALYVAFRTPKAAT